MGHTNIVHVLVEEADTSDILFRSAHDTWVPGLRSVAGVDIEIGNYRDAYIIICNTASQAFSALLDGKKVFQINSKQKNIATGLATAPDFANHFWAVTFGSDHDHHRISDFRSDGFKLLHNVLAIPHAIHNPVPEMSSLMPDDAPTPGIKYTNGHVLVVDRNHQNLYNAKTALSGYSLTLVDSHARAYNLLKLYRYDVVLIDALLHYDPPSNESGAVSMDKVGHLAPLGWNLAWHAACFQNRKIVVLIDTADNSDVGSHLGMPERELRIGEGTVFTSLEAKKKSGMGRHLKDYEAMRAAGFLRS